MEALKSGSDVLFILLGGIMVLAMHSGFAFLELGTVRKKNQVNALVKILVDFSVSTIAYFFIGYSIAYGVNFFSGADVLMQKNGFELTRFLFSADLRSGDSSDYFRRHRRTCPFQPAVNRDFFIGWLRLSFLRGDRLESGVWHPSLAARDLRRRIPRFRWFGRRACDGRVDRVARRATARRAAWTLQQERRDFGASAVIDSLLGSRRLDFDRRLVRLQRDERTDAG